MTDTGDRKSQLVDLFLSHKDIVLGCARYFAPSPDVAADIVQQVFVEFIEHAERWNLDSDITPLLKRLTRNIAYEHLRQYYRHSAEAMQKIAEYVGHVAETSVERESDTLFRDQIDALRECVANLPEKSKALIERHYRDGKTIRTLAESEGANENSLSQALCRIRIKLRKCIETKTGESDDR